MSRKIKLINNLAWSAIVELELLDSEDENFDEAFDEISEEFDENLAIVLACRNTIPQSRVPKATDWFSEVLPNLDDERFKKIVRVTRQQYSVILDKIKINPIFHGENSEKQFPVSKQLALVLYRLGSSGDGSTITKIATLFGIGDGATINRITIRIFQSLLELENDTIRWPTREEKDQIIMDTFHELPHCIGYLDGTDINLAYSPSLDHSSYFSRKQRYAIKAQAVCDHNLKIRHVVVGYPGSVHDARIFANSSLATRPSKYFQGPEWLAADSAYRLTERVMTPFRRNTASVPTSGRQKFNKYFSGYRVRIENCFGLLKQKFGSLRELRTKIKDSRSHRFACQWVTVCCILHNIILPFMEPEDFVEVQSLDEDDDDDSEALNEDEKAGELKRTALFNLILAKLG